MNDYSSALREGAKKTNPREAHNPSVQTSVRISVVLPSPCSHFGTIELRLGHRPRSTAGQRGRDAHSPIERAFDLQPQYWPRLHGRQYPVNWQQELVGAAHECLQTCCDRVEICCSGLMIVFKSSCAIFKRIPVNDYHRSGRRYWKTYLA